MKKNRIALLVVATLLLLGLVGTATFAWFFDKQETDKGLVQTTTIRVETDFDMTAYCENLYPGEVATLGNGRITNRGTRDIITRISLKDDYAILWNDPVNYPDFDASMGSDYTYDATKGGYVFSEDRKNLCFTPDFPITNGNDKFLGDSVNPNTYYVYIAAGETVDLGNIFVNINGALGGGYIERDENGNEIAPITHPRSFEMDNVHYYAKVELASCEPIRSAIMDIMGEDACQSMKTFRPGWIKEDFSNK